MPKVSTGGTRAWSDRECCNLMDFPRCTFSSVKGKLDELFVAWCALCTGRDAIGEHIDRMGHFAHNKVKQTRKIRNGLIWTWIRILWSSWCLSCCKLELSNRPKPPEPFQVTKTTRPVSSSGQTYKKFSFGPEILILVQFKNRFGFGSGYYFVFISVLNLQLSL